MGVIHANEAHAVATGAGVKVGRDRRGRGLHPSGPRRSDRRGSCRARSSTARRRRPIRRKIANGDCSNKAAVQDLQGHGTHVSTTIAGRVNGIGIAGVAPRATIVGLKACTIVGFCFADSVAAALRYAGDQGLDVVNLSLFADPYLYFCANDAGQRAVLHDLQTAARYAQQRGVVDRRRCRQRGRRPRPSDDGRDQPGLAARHRRRPRGPQQLPCHAGRAARRRHGLGDRASTRSPATRTSGRRWTSPRRAATRRRRQPRVYGRGRILAGWSSTDETGTWEALSAANRAVLTGGGRYVWISGTSMASPHARASPH